MNRTLSAGARAAAIGTAVLALSVTALGPVQAQRPIPQRPSMPVPAAADLAVARVTFAHQASHVRADLLDLRADTASGPTTSRATVRASSAQADNVHASLRDLRSF